MAIFEQQPTAGAEQARHPRGVVEPSQPETDGGNAPKRRRVSSNKFRCLVEAAGGIENAVGVLADAEAGEAAAPVSLASAQGSGIGTRSKLPLAISSSDEEDEGSGYGHTRGASGGQSMFGGQSTFTSAAAEAAAAESDDEVEITGGDPPPQQHQPMRRTVQMRITRHAAADPTSAEASDFNGSNSLQFHSFPSQTYAFDLTFTALTVCTWGHKTADPPCFWRTDGPSCNLCY
jgi:hypothetical protein